MKEAKENKQQELDQARRLTSAGQRRTIVLSIGLVLASLLSVIAFSFFRVSQDNLKLAEDHLANAYAANTQIANEQARTISERSTAQAASTQSINERNTAEHKRALAE